MYIRVINILCFPSISVYIDLYIYIYHKCNSAYNYKMYKVSSHALSINYLVTHTHTLTPTHTHTQLIPGVGTSFATKATPTTNGNKSTI